MESSGTTNPLRSNGYAAIVNATANLSNGLATSLENFRKALLGRFDYIAGQNEDRIKAIDALTAQVDELRAKLDANKDESQAMRQDLDATKAENQTLRKDMETMKTELRAEISTAGDAIKTELGEEIDSLEGYIMDQQSYDNILSSTQNAGQGDQLAEQFALLLAL
ncbi:hypothetical protein SLS58_002915 [Diplodia intermedia]|uniref:Uncharacterized protein n=1 Tax=Diplodia intermedia TaxID=856260 RepID=A0ABR3TYR3_9PEZI